MSRSSMNIKVICSKSGSVFLSHSFWKTITKEMFTPKKLQYLTIYKRLLGWHLFSMTISHCFNMDHDQPLVLSGKMPSHKNVHTFVLDTSLDKVCHTCMLATFKKIISTIRYWPHLLYVNCISRSLPHHVRYEYQGHKPNYFTFFSVFLSRNFWTTTGIAIGSFYVSV